MMCHKNLFFIVVVFALQSGPNIFGDFSVNATNDGGCSNKPETSYYFPSNTQQVRQAAAQNAGYGITSALKEVYGSQEYLVWCMQQAWQRQQEEQRIVQEKKRIEQEKSDKIIADHQAEFGMDRIFLKKLYQDNFDDVERWIKKATYLSKDQALAVWDGYCKKRCLHYGQKTEGRQRIVKKYDQREKVRRQDERAALERATLEKATLEKATLEKTLAKMDRETSKQVLLEQTPLEQTSLEQAKQEDSGVFIESHKDCRLDLESLQKSYENIPLFYDETVSVACQQRMQVREQALEQTKQESYKQHEESYELSHATQGYLRLLDINPTDFQQCAGTALQHVLHGEICDIFESAADISKQLPYHSSMLTQAALFADIAHDANRNELISLTCMTCDLSHGMIGFVLGVGKQMNRLFVVAGKQAVVSAVHALNPVEIAHGLQEIISCLSDDASCNTQEEMHIAEQMLTNQEFLKSKIDQRVEQVTCGVQCLSTSLQSWHHERSMEQKSHDVVKGITDVGVNFLVPDVVIGKVAKVLGLMSANIKAVRGIERAASILEEEISFTAAIESGTLLEKDIELLAQFKVGEQLIAAKEEQSFFQPMPWVVEEVRSPDGKIIEKMRACKSPNNRVTDPVLIEKAKMMAQQYFVVPEETVQKVKAFAQENKFFEMEFLGKAERFEVDWEHILLPMVKDDNHFNHVTKMKELKTFKIAGWHHGLWQEFEKQGLINIVNKVEKDGCVYLNFTWGYRKGLETKAFYPDIWSYDKIFANIKEALNNPYRFEKQMPLDTCMRGLTNEGVQIEARLSRMSVQDPWKINTAFISEEFFK